MALFLFFCSSGRFYRQYKTGQESQLLYEYVYIDDNNLGFLMVAASQKLAAGDRVNVVLCLWLCSKVKVSSRTKPSPFNWLEPVPLETEARVAQYLHGS
jgi:hypothetical protein